VRGYFGITDPGWYEHLARTPGPKDANFDAHRTKVGDDNSRNDVRVCRSRERTEFFAHRRACFKSCCAH
jgi:hypothetical protein